MDDALRRHLVELATVPSALAAFRRDPRSASRHLPDADAELLLRGGPGALHARLSGEDPPAEEAGSAVADALRAADLTVVGSGIRALGQFTVEALAAIVAADKVWYLIVDEVGIAVVRALNPRCETLANLYVEGQLRRRTYEEMADRILSSVRAGARTCAVFYGHPGVFVFPSKVAVEAARREGYVAELLPGVSSEDCLYADLGVDPGTTGWQSYEATDFLMHERAVERSAVLLLWQVGVLGTWGHSADGVDRSALRMLVEKLHRLYPAGHEVVLYEASIYPGSPTRKEVVRLDGVAGSAVSPATTMYLPPLRGPAVDAHWWTNRTKLAAAPPEG